MRRWAEVLIHRLWQAATMERRGVLVVGSVIVVLTLLATIVPHAVGMRTAPRPVTADPAPVIVETGPPELNSPFPPVPEGCPGPLVDPGTHVSVDWVPILVAEGHEYWGEDWHSGLTAGPEAVTVQCDIDAISGGGRAIVPKPWPDGSSTVLPVGTVVHEVAGSPRACFLMVDSGAHWLFRAVDADGGTPEVCIGVPEP